MTLVSYKPGTAVLVFGRPGKIDRLTGANEALVRFDDSNEPKLVALDKLQNPGKQERASPKPLEAVHDEDLQVAQKRFEVISPILAAGTDRGEAIRHAIISSGQSRATIFRWLRAYEDRGLLSDLVPNRRKSHKAILLPDIEEIISQTIRDVFMTRQRRVGKKVVEKVVERCVAAGLKPPHANSVYRRLKQVSERDKVRSRHSEKAAREKFDPIRGKYPDAIYPLSSVQIDHMKVDLELVDNVKRQPIGRPWLTVAIDTYSRMIVGFYLSLDPPSAFSVGMCIRNMVLRKEEFLLEQGVQDAAWPVWGKPDVIHADNGKDFRSKTLINACREHNIQLHWRPVTKPHFGGHIERLIGTIARELKDLPGTTFSNPRERAEYKSREKSAISLDGYRRLLTLWITKIYHLRKHQGLGCPPIGRWEDGVLGRNGGPGTGHKDLPADPQRFQEDFLPYAERTVQRDGIHWDGLIYYSDALRPWIRPGRKGKDEKFIVRRNPLDITYVLFLDRKIGRYFRIACSDRTVPPTSLWEFKEVKRLETEALRRAPTPIEMTHALKEYQATVDDEVAKTVKARRNKERRRQHGEERKRLTPSPEVQPEMPRPNSPSKGLRVVVNNETPPSEKATEPDTFDLTDDDFKPKWEEWR
jgi:putative transposase